MRREVVGPDRVKWKVGREWLPHRVRFGRPDWRDWGDPGLGGGGDLFDAAGIVAALGVVAVAMVVFLVVFPLVAIAIEIVLLLILLLAGIAGRVVLRRPWTVRAVSAGEDPRELKWHVVGWRASRARIAEVAAALEQGLELPRPTSTSGPEPRPLIGSGS